MINKIFLVNRQFKLISAFFILYAEVLTDFFELIFNFGGGRSANIQSQECSRNTQRLIRKKSLTSSKTKNGSTKR